MWIVKYRVNGKAPLYAKSYDTNDKGQAEMMFWGDWYGNRLEVSPDDGLAKIECVVKSNENQKTQKFCVELDSETLEKAKTEAVKRGVETSIAGKTGPFIRYLLESYINAKKE